VVQVVKAMEGDGVFGRIIPNGSSEAGNFAFSNVVGGFTTDKETVATKNGISNKGRSLWERDQGWGSCDDTITTNLEYVKKSASVETRLLVYGVQDRCLVVFLWVERGVQVELEPLCNLVVELQLTFEHVRGGPSLGDSQTVLNIGILGFNFAVNVVRLGMTVSCDLESDVGRGFGLDFQRSSLEVEVLAKKVIGRLAKVLELKHRVRLCTERVFRRAYLPGGGNGLR
jgi:hypothetical protein